MARAPIRTPVREPTDEPKKKVRLRKNTADRSMLDLPAETIDFLKAQDVDLQWVTDSVVGQPMPWVMGEFVANAWEPVTPDMWNGLFDGMYTKKGHVGQIEYGGLVLMWRPMELTMEARHEDALARDNAIRAQQNMLKTGQIPGFSAGFEPDHPTAIAKNVLTRTVKPPMEIPRD